MGRRILVGFLVTAYLSGCAGETEHRQPIAPVALTPFADGQFSVLMADLTYTISRPIEESGHDTSAGSARSPVRDEVRREADWLESIDLTIVVPAGFVTDFASTPRPLWSVVPPFGKYQLAAVVHDFLYWDQGCTREQADEWFRIAMQQSDVSPAERDAMWEAVRKFGGAAWASNAAAKATGQLRIIPKEYRQIPPGVDMARVPGTAHGQRRAAGTQPDAVISQNLSPT